MEKLNIWVLMGGTSSEREVSLRSGAGVLAALQKKGHKAEGFDVRPGPSFLKLHWETPPDAVFIGLHGTFGEDGVIQGFLESIGVPYVGSNSKASALCFHKGLTKKILMDRGVKVPRSIDIQEFEDFKKRKSEGVFGSDDYLKNWFIKPAREGSTVGIERHRGDSFKSSTEAEKTFETSLKKSLEFDSYVLIEEWVEGVEVTATIFEGKALPLVEIRPQSQFFDYKSKYTKGLTDYFCPAPVSEELTRKCQSMAEQAFRFLECRDYGRADFILGPAGPVFLEMNTLPGMTETSLVPKAARASGIEYEDFCDRLVRAAAKRGKI